jgi:kinetochor protein Mis14/NSL1
LIEEESKEDDERDEQDEDKDEDGNENAESRDWTAQDAEAMDVDVNTGATGSEPASTNAKRRSRRGRPDPAWTLDIPLGTDEEAERWRSGDIAEVYESTLRTLQRLQGEGDAEIGGAAGSGSEGNALATTVGKAERAGRAAEVVESM